MYYLSIHLMHRLRTHRKLVFDKFKTFNKAYFVACGTAYHACLSGANILERLTGIPTFTQVASEFRYCDPIVDEKTMCVFVSQSGETADTMAALRLAKEKGCTTIAVANVLGSSISREADHTIYTCAGPEIAVASTKAYTTQLIVLLLLGMYISQALGNENEDYKRIIEGIASLPQHIENILKDEKTFEHYASYLKDLKDTYYIGRSLDYATVLEGALKLKEVSYVHADAYIAGELKHGPIALIEQGSLVIAVATQPNIAAKTISNIQETIARGANVILFTIDGQEVGNVKETYILSSNHFHKFLLLNLSFFPTYGPHNISTYPLQEDGVPRSSACTQPAKLLAHRATGTRKILRLYL